jgi:hypothetical protein
MPDQKITVDININSESLREIPQYKAAFDSLKTSIDSLNKEVLKQNTQSKEAVTWGSKIKTTVKDLADSYELFGKVINIATDGIKGWQNILAAAFTLITTYGPQVLDYLGDMFQSEKTKQAAEVLRTYSQVMETYIDNVSNEVSELGMLVNIATNDNLSKENKLEAIKKLNDLSPKYLNNLTLENIKTKEGIGLLNEYTASLNRKAMEEAIQSQRVALVKQRLDLKPEYDNKKQLVEEYRTGKRPSKEPYKQLGYNIGATFIEGSEGLSDKKTPAEIDYTQVTKKDAAILKKISLLDKMLAETLTKYAPKPDINPAHNKAYWETLIADQQTQLDRLDTSSTTFKKQAQPIVERIKSARAMLAKYAIAEPISIKHKNDNHKVNTADKDQEALLDSQSRMAMMTLQGYAKEIEENNKHFEKLKNQHKNNKATIEQLERERIATLEQINKKFNNDELAKLDAYKKQLTQISIDNIKVATERELAELKQETKERTEEMDQQSFSILNNINDLQQQITTLKKQGKNEEAKIIEKAIANEMQMLEASGKIKEDFIGKQNKKEASIIQGKADGDEKEEENKLSGSIQTNQQNGRHIKALQEQQQLLDIQLKAAVDAAKKQGKATSDIEIDFAKKKAAVEEQLTTAKIHAGDKFINAVLANSKKDSAIYKAAFLAKKATSVADTIISTKQAVLDSLKAYSGIPFIGQALGIAQAAFMAAQGASSIATIIKQKPGFATGGQYMSDGRGALLPGYSRTDNTNAYLRSGEAVVVSEAMRNPWARNLVSAINVAHGGRDFSMPNTGRGYAIGGIFTDGGNANRYYNQPVNDIKDMANTLAYQMINNFPPIYVDVKDVNNQQNILAQTVNRVNL